MGRTGTFITIDHILEQAGKEGVVNIPGVINKIRHQRMKLVQTVVCDNKRCNGSISSGGMLCGTGPVYVHS